MIRIPISKPYFGEEERRAVQRPLETGWVVQGRYVAEFEEKFAAYAHSPHAAATTSCTTALHLAVAALDLKPGQEVIVPAFTWVASANVVEYMGARPIFCDVDLETYNSDPGRIAALITPRTVGIIPVHLFGLCAEMDGIMSLAERHGLWVVEDAACATGGWYRGRHAGTFGDFGCVSFHPRKSITTGEGGMVLTRDPARDSLIRSLRDHGASTSDLARHTSATGFLLPEYRYLGYNFRMTDIQGALGSIQMDRLEWILSERARMARRYDEALADLSWLRTPSAPEQSVHGYQAYVCQIEGTDPAPLREWRDRLMARLQQERGIATRQGTHAPVTQRYYLEKYGLKPEMYPNSVLAENGSLALPLFAGLSEADQSEVIEAVRALA